MGRTVLVRGIYIPCKPVSDAVLFPSWGWKDTQQHLGKLCYFPSLRRVNRHIQKWGRTNSQRKQNQREITAKPWFVLILENRHGVCKNLRVAAPSDIMHYEDRAVKQKSFYKVEQQWGLWKNICFKSVSSAFCIVLRRNFITERNLYWNISLEKKSSVFLLQSIGYIPLKKKDVKGICVGFNLLIKVGVFFREIALQISLTA